MIQNPLKLDANEQVFFDNQLKYVMKKTYDIVYPDLKARSLIPPSFQIPTGAKTFSYYQYDQVGIAKIVSSYANDFPRVDIFGKEFIGQIRSIGDSYGVNIQDIRAAKLTGMPLEAKKAAAAKRAALLLENNIAFFGDATNNLVGLLSEPNVPNGIVLNDGVGNSTLWKDKTPDQILRDISEAMEFMADATKGMESPNTLLLPNKQFMRFSTLKVGPDSTTTVMMFIKANFPGITNIEWVNELKGSGTGSSDQFVLYNRSPDKLEMQIPQDFEQFPQGPKNLDMEVSCHMRTGGTTIYAPLSIVKRYGI